jgi:O-antigen/teichoic acid export membrane protein
MPTNKNPVAPAIDDTLAFPDGDPNPVNITRATATADSQISAGDATQVLDEGPITGFLHLVRRAGIVLVIQIVGAGVTYGVQVLLARLLGASHYGTYAYVIVWVGFAALVAGLGFPAASIRFLPVYRIRKDWPRFHGFVREASRATFATALAMALGTLGVAEALHASGLLAHTSVAVLGALLVPAFAGSMLYTEIARSGGQMGVAFIPSMIVRPALIGIGAVAIFAATGALSTNAALGASLGAGYVVLAVQYVLTRRRLDGPKAKPHPVAERREWFGVGISLLAAGAFTVTFMQVDIVIVGALRGPRDAGIYAAASKTASLVSFVILAVNAAAAPQFASLWALGRIADLQRLVSKLATLIFWPSFVISAGIAALSVPLLGLFGSEFQEARPALLVLLVGQLVNAAAGSVGYLLTVTGHHREATLALGLSAVACTLLAIAGVLAFGLVGAALGTTLGFVLWNGSLYWLVVRKLGIHASIFSSLHMPRHRLT